MNRISHVDLIHLSRHFNYEQKYYEQEFSPFLDCDRRLWRAWYRLWGSNQSGCYPSMHPGRQFQRELQCPRSLDYSLREHGNWSICWRWRSRWGNLASGTKRVGYTMLADIKSSLISKFAVALCTSSSSSRASMSRKSDRAWSGSVTSTLFLGIQRSSASMTL